jgi:hypothetical protein
LLASGQLRLQLQQKYAQVFFSPEPEPFLAEEKKTQIAAARLRKKSLGLITSEMEMTH